jgi:hypothetical protein
MKARPGDVIESAGHFKRLQSKAAVLCRFQFWS